MFGIKVKYCVHVAELLCHRNRYYNTVCCTVYDIEGTVLNVE